MQICSFRRNASFEFCFWSIAVPVFLAPEAVVVVVVF